MPTLMLLLVLKILPLACSRHGTVNFLPLRVHPEAPALLSNLTHGPTKQLRRLFILLKHAAIRVLEVPNLSIRRLLAVDVLLLFALLDISFFFKAIPECQVTLLVRATVPNFIDTQHLKALGQLR